MREGCVKAPPAVNELLKQENEAANQFQEQTYSMKPDVTGNISYL